MGNDFEATLGLNPQAYNRGMDAARAKAVGFDRVLSKVGNSFANKLTSFFSAGMVANVATQITRAVIDSATEVTKLADEFSLSIEEVQLLQDESIRTGKSIADMTSSAEALTDALKSAKQAGWPTLPERDIKALTELGRLIGLSQQFGKRAAGTFASPVAEDIVKNPKASAFGLLTNPGAFIGQALGKRLNEVALKKATGTPEELDTRREISALDKERSDRGQARVDAISEANEAAYKRKMEAEKEVGRVARERLQNPAFPRGDSLVSVGNFIGTNPDRTTEQINIQREMLAKLKELVQDQRTKPGVSLRSN